MDTGAFDPDHPKYYIDRLLLAIVFICNILSVNLNAIKINATTSLLYEAESNDYTYTN